MTIDHRPKATDNPNPGPIANAREHLPLIRRECMPPTVTAVERLIEYAERCEAIDPPADEPADCPTDDAMEPDWDAMVLLADEIRAATGCSFNMSNLRAYHEAVHAKPPADPYEGWTASYDSHGPPWRWSHFSTASIQIDRLGRYSWFPADTNFCDPDDFTNTFAEAARLALGGVK